MRPVLFALAVALLLTACAEPEPMKALDPAKAAPKPSASASSVAAPAAPSPATGEPRTPCGAALPHSGEGMWPWNDLVELDAASLKARGLELAPGELWTPGEGGLLQAVAGLRGCSASFVSDDGLLLTNHHCAYGVIQKNSTTEHNYLEDGFVARDRAAELPGHGTTVRVFHQQTDVTERMLYDLPEGLDGARLMKEIERRESELVRACEEKPDTRCEVARENHGLRFVLLEDLEIKDVRLVAAPPSSLGEFGGEIDNWHWPRHTLDFALLRAYVAPDGAPREAQADNVPYKPARHLKVATEPLREGDLVMVVGKPGRTSRHLTAHGVKDALDWTYPTKERLFSEWIRALEGAARASDEARIKTAGMLKGLNNALFNARGMIEGLRRNRVVRARSSEEKAWRAWLAEDSERGERWGDTLTQLDALHAELNAGRERALLMAYLARRVPMFRFAHVITRWATEQARPDGEREPGFQERDRAGLLRELDGAQASLHLPAEQRVLELFLGRLCRLQQEDEVQIIRDRVGPRCDARKVRVLVEDLLGGTKLMEAEARRLLFGKPLEELEGSGDRMIQLALSLMPIYDRLREHERRGEGKLFRVNRGWLASRIAFRGQRFYPDANSTPRISIAHVSGYEPRDGVWHTPFTSFSGLADKVTGRPPFEAPERLMAAVEAHDWSRYAHPDLGEVVLNVLSNADTTGGNSGSPVLDGGGRVVGLNFDRVYENIAGDFAYNPARSRNIFVSTSAVLWYLDRAVNATSVLQELGHSE